MRREGKNIDICNGMFSDLFLKPGSSNINNKKGNVLAFHVLTSLQHCSSVWKSYWISL